MNDRIGELGDSDVLQGDGEPPQGDGEPQETREDHDREDDSRASGKDALSAERDE